MNTLINHSCRTFIVLTFLFAAIFYSSCKEQPNAKETTTTVKAPSTDIHTAILANDIDVVKQHIAAKSDINVKDPVGGSSPLISACLFGKTEIAKLLIDAGAKLDFQNNDGSTALHTAAFFCHPEIVKMLLANGANKNIRNKYEQTAYETVAAPFANVRNTYELLGSALEPMGLKLDYAYIERTRPEVAELLK